MTAAAWALVVLFVIMLGLLVSIVLYRDDDESEAEPVAEPAETEDAFIDELDLPLDVREMLEEQEVNTVAENKEPKPDTAETGQDDLSLSSLLQEIDEDSEFDQDEIDEMFRETDPEFDLSYDLSLPEKPDVPETQQPDPDISSDADIVRRGIAMAWQESEVIMSVHTFGNALLYEWEGLVRNEKFILFDVREHGLAYPLMETVRALSAANQKPACRFAVLIHTGDDRSKENCTRALGWLRSEDRTPSFMISDSGGMGTKSETLKKYILLSVGSCPVLQMTADCSEDTALRIFKDAMEKYRLRTLSETAAEAFTLIKNDFPLSLRRGLTGASQPERAFRKAVEMIPEIKGWGLPEIRTETKKGGCSIRLKACDDVQMEEILSLLHSEAARYSCTLRLVSSQKAGTALSADSDAFKTVAAAVCDCTDYEKALPVLSESDYTIRSLRCIGMPYELFTRRQLNDILNRLIKG